MTNPRLHWSKRHEYMDDGAPHWYLWHVGDILAEVVEDLGTPPPHQFRWTTFARSLHNLDAVSDHEPTLEGAKTLVKSLVVDAMAVLR